MSGSVGRGRVVYTKMWMKRTKMTWEHSYLFKQDVNVNTQNVIKFNVFMNCLNMERWFQVFLKEMVKERWTQEINIYWILQESFHMWLFRINTRMHGNRREWNIGHLGWSWWSNWCWCEPEWYWCIIKSIF